MAQLTIEYDGKNVVAKSIINLIKTVGVFRIVKDKTEEDLNDSPYSPNFVRKIEESRNSKGQGIETADLWK